MTGSVTIIGAGKVGNALALSLFHSGVSVDKIISKSADSARALARLTGSLWSINITEAISSDFIILCVPDSEIENVCNNMGDVSGSIVVHTAGTSTIDVLGLPECRGRGIFYPLQTFTTGRDVNISIVPFLVEGDSVETEDLIFRLAESLSDSVFRVASEDRKMIHLAAVFVSNFVNHLFLAGKQISSKTELPFSILRPLIEETYSKAMEIGPASAQTGPAVRNDLGTIEKQIDLLSFSSEFSEIYKAVTRSIIINKE